MSKYIEFNTVGSIFISSVLQYFYVTMASLIISERLLPRKNIKFSLNLTTLIINVITTQSVTHVNLFPYLIT